MRGAVTIPVAVKLSPFYSSLPALRPPARGAPAPTALVLFNRFYQPDIDLEALEVVRTLQLSDSRELLLRLRWLAILSGACDALARGDRRRPHGRSTRVKAIMAGAHAVQMVSALLRHGPEHLRDRASTSCARWLEEHEYESLAQAHGSMNLARCPDPTAYERGELRADPPDLARLAGGGAAAPPTA